MLFLLLAAALNHQALQAELERLASTHPGTLGICVQDDTRQTCVNASKPFPLQSVMKLPVSLAVLDAVDRGRLRLNQQVIVHREDLSLYVQPLSKLVTAKGYRTTISDLIRRAIVDSDSAATDILIAKLGGPEKVQAFLQSKSLPAVRIDRDERHLQTEILGIQWSPELVDPAVLDEAIKKIPESTREAAWARYLADPRDTATPQAMAQLLHQLAAGKLLSHSSTRFILTVMGWTATGADRLKAGLAPGWSLAHKTGTSNTWKGVTAATNDVGRLTAPGGQTLAIAVFVANSPASAPDRAALIAAAARAVIAQFH